MPHGRILYILAVMAIGALPAQGLDFYVDPVNGDDRRSIQAGQDSTLAFRTITQALRIAHLVPGNRPHVVHLASATYSPSNGETFPLRIDEPGIYLNARARVIFDAENTSRFFDINAPTSNFVIQNILFFNGRAENGGVVSCNACTLRVTDNRFIGNNAESTGHVVHMSGGRLTFVRNQLDNNGLASAGDTGAVIAINNVRSDTLQRDAVRNNTFYRNGHTAISAGGSNVEISGNIFLDPAGPAILDASPTATPLVRHNLFWETDILYVDDAGDSIKVSRTVRDTVTLDERGIYLPSFVTNVPDTAAQANVRYNYFIEVEGDREQYAFTPLSIPADARRDHAEDGLVNWIPDQADTGSINEIRYSITSPDGIVRTLQYNLRVFTAETFPDTAEIGLQDTLFFVPDTTGALSSINALQSTFSTAASAGGNLYLNPALLDTAFNRFELDIGSPAIDAGPPEVAFKDQPRGGTGPKNDMGNFGGPRQSGPPEADTTFKQLKLVNLPDSVAFEGQTYTYDPALEAGDSANVFLVDILPEFKAPSMERFPQRSGEGFGKAPPILWTPTLADTGRHLIGVKVFAHPDQEGLHYFDVRVRPNNEPPSLLPSADSLAFEDSLYSAQIAAVDPNGDPISFTLLSGPTGAALSPDGLLQWTPTQADIGPVLFNLLLADDRGASRETVIRLQVLNTNDPPRITSQAPTTATEDRPYHYSLSAEDPDPADSLSFSLDSAPDGMAIQGDSALVWTPDQTALGPNTVVLRLHDNAGGSATQTFTITVAGVDDPPWITGTPDTTAVEDEPYRYTLAAEDEEGAPLAFRLVTAPVAMVVDSTGTLSWTPTQADIGPHEIVVEAVDSAGQAARQLYILTVSAVDDPPELTTRSPTNAQLFPSPGNGLSFSVTFADEEGVPLAFSWRLNGAVRPRATAASFIYTPSTDRVDTLVAGASDGTSMVETTWIIDARPVPQIILDLQAVDFGTLSLGQTGSVTISLTNPGNADLTISDLAIGDLNISARFSAARIAPGDSATLTLDFTPVSAGAFSSSVGFVTNAATAGQVELPVSAEVTAPGSNDGFTANVSRSVAAARPGDTLTVELDIVGAAQAKGGLVTAVYDGDLLHFVDFVAGDLITGLLTLPGTPQVGDDGLSTVQGGGTQLVGPPAAGDGRLGSLRFTVIGEIPVDGSFVSLTQVQLTASATDRSTLSFDRGAFGVSLQASASGDFSGDDRVDFDDFFLFADRFGSTNDSASWNPVFDLVPNGVVDFDDFFAFADLFGSGGNAAAPAGKRTSVPGLELAATNRADSLLVSLLWNGATSLRGFGLDLDYDADILEFAAFIPANGALRIEKTAAGGHLRLAAALPSTAPDFDTELGHLLFARRTGDVPAHFAPLAASGFAGGKSFGLAVPATLVAAPLPQAYWLGSAYPNPFNPETSLPFAAPEAGRLQIRVYDLLGQPVQTLLDGRVGAGRHQVRWDGRDANGRPAAAGVYLVEMRAADFRRVGKMLLLK